MKSKLGWITFGLLLVIPRVLRMMWADVQIEDPNYIYGAFLIMKGMLPFAEFAQVNPPLLESIIAVFYKIFGVSHRVAEVLSALAYIASALMIFLLGTRTVNRAAGIAASLLYSWHFLLFRYHVFERETFATLAILVGLEFLTRKEQTPWSSLAAGLVMGFGFACKQTALIPYAAIFAFILVCRRDWRAALKLGLGFCFFTGLMTIGYSLAFGKLYMEQTFWFHWIKGFVAPWHIKAIWSLGGLGYLVPVALAGLIWLKNPKKDWNWLWFLLIGVDLVFFWVVSGAFWPHYLLSTIPFLALLSGSFMGNCWLVVMNGRMEEWANGGKDERTNGDKDKWTKGRAATGVFILCAIIAYLQFFHPGALIGKEAATNYGFAGVPRGTVAAVAAAIRENTSEDDLIISDPFIALESQRIKVVRFKDNWGLILWMQRKMEKDEYKEAVKELSKQRFGDVRRESHRYWMPLIETAFAMDSVGAVQPNYELPLQPDELVQKGFGVVYRSKQYVIWARDRSKDLTN